MLNAKRLLELGKATTSRLRSKRNNTPMGESGLVGERSLLEYSMCCQFLVLAKIE